MSVDSVGNLRDELHRLASGAEDVVKRFEENAQNPSLGKQQGLMEAVVINQYAETAQKLLKAAPDDAEASAALEHVAALRKRMADAQ